jgi:hypothetical protein
VTDIDEDDARIPASIAAWLRAHDPAADIRMTDEEFEAASSALRARQQSARGRRASRRNVRLTIGGAAAALLFAIATPAVAGSLFSAQIGSIVPEGDTENAPGSELIDVKAEDFADYAQSVFPYDLPVPEGVNLDDVRVYETGRILEKASYYESDPGVLAADQTIVDEFAVAVWCLWSDELEESVEVGDHAREDRARAVIVSAPQWEAVANPGSTFSGVSLQGFFRIAATHAQAGDDSVQRFVAAYSGFSCSFHEDLDSYRGR